MASKDIVRFPMTELVRRDWKTHEAILAELTRKAGACQFDIMELSRTVMTIFDDGDYADRSIGFEWIRYNARMFAQVVPDPEEFLRQHADICFIGSQMLISPEILDIISSDRLADFAFDMYYQYGAWNNSFVGNLLDRGVTREQIMFMLMAKAEKYEAGSKSAEKFFDEFLQYGHDIRQRQDGKYLFRCNRAQSKTLWAMFTDEEFIELVWECVLKAPRMIFKWRHLLEVRIINPELFGNMMVMAMEQGCFTSLLHLELEHFRGVPDDTREKLLARLVPCCNSARVCAEFVIDLLVRQDYDGGQLSLERSNSWGLLEKIGGHPLLRVLWRMRYDTTNRDLIHLCRTTFEQILLRQQCIMARVERGEHRGEVQWQVRWSGDCYVMDRHQHHYGSDHHYRMPRDGEWVFVYIGQQALEIARYGEHRVIVTTFSPVESMPS